MKKLLVAAVIAGSCFSLEANAQERAGSAAIGAVSGAVVLGPVGAVAGAVIGYAAGPEIARSWGANRHKPRPRAHVSKPPAHVVMKQASRRSNAPAPGTVTPQAGGVGGPAAQGFE